MIFSESIHTSAGNDAGSQISLNPRPSSGRTNHNRRSAIQTVLELPELLETIILHLPAPEVLTAALRVCRSWNAFINSSPEILKQLFMQPKTASKVATPKEMEEVPKQPFNVPIYNDTFRLNPIFGQYDRRSKLPLEYIPWSMLTLQSLPNPDAPAPNYHRVFKAYRVQSFEEDCSRPHVSLHPEASWRRMFVSDPPCKVLSGSVIKWVGPPSAPHSRVANGVSFSVQDKAGITLGLLEEIFSKVKEQPVRYAGQTEVELNGLQGYGYFAFGAWWDPDMSWSVSEDIGRSTKWYEVHDDCYFTGWV